MGNKEIRDILFGRIVRQNEQFWAAAPADAKIPFHGLRDGAGDVRLFGVTHLTRRYQTVQPDAALAEAERALYSMGRPMRLASMPESRGCLYTPHWIAPVLLVAEQDGDGLQMTAYTGRSLLVGRIRCHIALWILEQRLPEGITCIGKVNKRERNQTQKEKSLKRKQTAKSEPSAGSVGTRAVSPKKKKAAPKRLMK